MAKAAVLTGRHFMMGNIACAEGALAAGCRFAAGYPITPATEVAERLAERLPAVGGTFLQMEDEIASMAAIIGASWGGMKTLTATSGPGISLMLENIGFAVGTETPCVIVNVMRGGPTTGIPTVELQGDVIQVRRGSHGDYQIIALAPSSVQECFDYTVEAFNLAERFRTPVFVLTDAFLGHMREELLIPEPAAIPLADRRLFPKGVDTESLAGLPGRGRGPHARLRPGPQGPRDQLVPRRLRAAQRGRRLRPGCVHQEAPQQDRDPTGTRSSGSRRTWTGPRSVLVSYGSIFRCAQAVVEAGRAQGLKLGWLKLGTLWPFADKEIRAVAERAKRLIVLENNLGQLVPLCAGRGGRSGPRQLPSAPRPRRDARDRGRPRRR